MVRDVTAPGTYCGLTKIFDDANLRRVTKFTHSFQESLECFPSRGQFVRRQPIHALDISWKVYCGQGLSHWLPRTTHSWAVLETLTTTSVSSATQQKISKSTFPRANAIASGLIQLTTELKDKHSLAFRRRGSSKTTHNLEMKDS